ncbi:MAG: tRNA (adenosine(37)-N6)-threonylcarbamoyltransferase complex dimerization subunit type 1 TsaB [Phycisphaerales bacterium]|nr:tRNA (adenosine(37)-N6)-threonylcarbamoyltransferase complex dimerization subunit type 1 TsaB [Phycisphaerales bacterium]
MPILTLAIEISNPSAAVASSGSAPSAPPAAAGVALGQIDGSRVEVIATEPLRATGRHDDDLMPAIERVCERCEVRARELQRIIVSVGPGGYTGLRIAVAAAKMIAEASGAQCTGVPSAAVAAEGARPRLVSAGLIGKSWFTVALASKTDSAWLTMFPTGWNPGEAIPEGQLVSSARFAEGSAPWLASAIVADQFLPASMREAALARGVPLLPLELSAEACLHAGARLAAGDPMELLPLYPREPDAVTLWNQRKKA